MRLTRGKSLLFGTITVLALLGCAELGLRVWAHYLRESYERYDSTTEAFSLVPGTHRGGSIVINSAGFAGRELQPDGEDLYRIVAVGESTTFSGGSPTGSWPAIMGQLLEEHEARDRRYEVVNGGIQGLDSAQILTRLKHNVLPIEPDVVLIWSGWNDLMKYDVVGQSNTNRWAALSRGMERLWLVRGLRKLLFVYLRAYVDPPATGPESRSGEFIDLNPTYFAENLRDMIRSAKDAGARPVVLTLATVVRPDMTVEDIGDAHVIFPYQSSAYGVLDFIDLVAAYNRTIRAIAVEENVPVAHVDKWFAARPDFRELFFDTMHTTTKGREFLAEGLVEMLNREGLL